MLKEEEFVSSFKIKKVRLVTFVYSAGFGVIHKSNTQDTKIIVWTLFIYIYIYKENNNNQKNP